MRWASPSPSPPAPEVILTIHALLLPLLPLPRVQLPLLLIRRMLMWTAQPLARLDDLRLLVVVVGEQLGVRGPRRGDGAKPFPWVLTSVLSVPLLCSSGCLFLRRSKTYVLRVILMGVALIELVATIGNNANFKHACLTAYVSNQSLACEMHSMHAPDNDVTPLYYAQQSSRIDRSPHPAGPIPLSLSHAQVVRLQLAIMRER